MKLKTARKAGYICLAAVIVIALLAVAMPGPITFILLILAVAAECTVFGLFIRCPRCEKHLDRVGMRSDLAHCPFCGKDLLEDVENELEVLQPSDRPD